MFHLGNSFAFKMWAYYDTNYNTLQSFNDYRK